MINRIIEFLGFAPISYNTNPKVFPWVYVITNIWKSFGWNSIIYTVSACVGVILIGAPASYALARLRFRGSKTLLKLFVLGMSVPVVTLLIFNFITIWNEYFISYILIDDAKLKPVAVGLYFMVQSMKYSGDWAAMFAAVVIVFLPTFILYIFLSDKIIAGVTGGGVKG